MITTKGLDPSTRIPTDATSAAGASRVSLTPGSVAFRDLLSLPSPERGADSPPPSLRGPHVVPLDEPRLHSISRALSSGQMRVEEFFSSIGLSPGREVILALPEANVLTLRRAGRGDVVWVDPPSGMDLLNTIVSGDLLQKEAHGAPALSEYELFGLAIQGFAIQGALPKRAAYPNPDEWRREAASRASYVVHELAHTQDGVAEYQAFKRENEYLARRGEASILTPRAILREIADGPYSPFQIMKAVAEATRCEHASLSTAEFENVGSARWYGCSREGAHGVILRVVRGLESWNIAVCRLPADFQSKRDLFSYFLGNPIKWVSVSEAELAKRSTTHEVWLPSSLGEEKDSQREIPKSVAALAETAMTKILEKSEGPGGVSRALVDSVFQELGLLKKETPVRNFLLDFLGL